jgi:PAS domain S-box-containing protein
LAALALMRYYTKGHLALLFIGAGFLGTGLIDAYSVFVGASWVGPPTLEAMRLSSWTWFASRTFLASALLVGWFRGRGRRRGRSLAIRERIVYLGALVVPLIIMAVFVTVPLPRYVFPEFVLSRPFELVPGILFVAGLVAYLREGRWRSEVVEHWMVITLLVSASADLIFMPFADVPFGPFFDAAHIIKLIGYLSALVGLLAGFFVASRREEEVMGHLREANDALAREISVRRAAEKVLMEGESRLQDFLDNANDLIQSTAPDGRIIYVNRAWKETLGYGDRPMEGLSIFSIIHPTCRERVRREFDRLINGESISNIEVEFMTADGRVVICAGGVNCLVEGDRVVAVRSIFRDVTQQKIVEGSLELSQANLTALIENTGDAIWSVGRDHRLITYNSAYALEVEALTGREPRVTDPPERVVPFHQIERMRDLYNQALAGKRFSELSTENVAGQIRTVELFFNPIQDQKGTSGVVVFGKDVTPRLRAEEAMRAAKDEAEAANQAKSRFLANMSHELRTPLNSVIGFANVLMKNKGDRLSDKDLNFVGRIVSNGRHLLTLINEVLDLAKIEAGRMDLDLSTVDLGHLVRETTQQIEGQVRGKPVELRTEVPDGLDMVETDAHKLKQVLINLIGNAIKFTAEGSVTVRVRADEAGGRATAIEVVDTGLGIPESRLEAIFEAFQQADSGTSRRFGGTGLGLTISRSMVQLLGGEMRVESEEGKGSVFTIELPGPVPVRTVTLASEPDLILERLAALPDRRAVGGT